jgi:hypothetical protein
MIRRANLRCTTSEARPYSLPSYSSAAAAFDDGQLLHTAATRTIIGAPSLPSSCLHSLPPPSIRLHTPPQSKVRGIGPPRPPLRFVPFPAATAPGGAGEHHRHCTPWRRVRGRCDRCGTHSNNSIISI